WPCPVRSGSGREVVVRERGEHGQGGGYRPQFVEQAVAKGSFQGTPDGGVGPSVQRFTQARVCHSHTLQFSPHQGLVTLMSVLCDVPANSRCTRALPAQERYQSGSVQNLLRHALRGTCEES